MAETAPTDAKPRKSTQQRLAFDEAAIMGGGSDLNFFAEGEAAAAVSNLLETQGEGAAEQYVAMELMLKFHMDANLAAQLAHFIVQHVKHPESEIEDDRHSRKRRKHGEEESPEFQGKEMFAVQWGEVRLDPPGTEIAGYPPLLRKEHLPD